MQGKHYPIKPNPYHKRGQVLLLYGLGCKKFPNCFECPFVDCLSAPVPSGSLPGAEYVYCSNYKYSRKPV